MTRLLNMSRELSDHDLEAIERRTREIGGALFRRLQARRPGPLNPQWWDDRLMDWAMRDESVKVQMFRFIDVLPMLTDDEALVAHVHEYFDPVASRLPAPARWGLHRAKRDSWVATLVAAIARRQSQAHARRFIAGTNAKEVLAAAAAERARGRAFTLDILGEAVASQQEADRYLDSYLQLLEDIAPTVNAWPQVPALDHSPYGRLPRVNVSVKLSALDSQFDPIDPRGSAERVGARLRALLRLARQHNAYVHVDMESYHAKDLTLSIFKQILLEDEFRATSDVGIVIQCYLRDAERDLRDLAAWVEQRGTQVWVRLVKGAYWDYETVHAESEGWPVPVFQQKWQSDANFERQTRFVLRHHQRLRPALGSHNLRSIAHGIAAAEHLGLPAEAVELQMLYGMADAEKKLLVEEGYRMRVYMPYGQLIPGMAYLVRRLLENTSNDSFLRASVTKHASPEKLLMNPADHAKAHREPPAVHAAPRHVPPQAGPIAEFQNEPLTDFARPEASEAMQAALRSVRSQLDRFYPLWIDGRPVETAQRFEARNPANVSERLGLIAQANGEHVEQAVAAARKALPAWNGLGANRRAEFLQRLAQRMRARRFELAAWEVLECGKPWRESDADVAEAIDFCEYYARAAVELEQPHGVDLAGEENRFVYTPRGVVAVIAPWNFPLAILTGMTVAALATGNTVVMKPAEQSALVGALLMQLFQEAEAPAGIVNYLPGPGESVGAALVDHPAVALIAFTGSREVGLHINRRAAEVSASGPTSVKRVIAEMGGKNAIIVDDDADLDEAVLGVVRSAFGYQGQKCSACSRCIVLAKVYDAFLERLVEATRSLNVGLPEEPGVTVGPVIDAAARDRILKFIEFGKQEGRLALGVDVGPLAEQGYFVGPHIFADVPPEARIAQQEIFGPVLAVHRVENLDEALQIANGTDYALTGGIFSRSPAALERARREFLVGNLYLNRGITGALVGRQPFGGFKMSGIGSKAGGSEYLLQFVLPRTITENTMRRGFAPPSSASAATSPQAGE